MVQGMPVWIVCLPYCRTIPDLPLKQTRLHLVLYPETLEAKVRNPGTHFTVTVVYRQEDKCVFTPWMLQTEDVRVCVCLPSSEGSAEVVRNA